MHYKPTILAKIPVVPGSRSLGLAGLASHLKAQNEGKFFKPVWISLYRNKFDEKLFRPCGQLGKAQALKAYRTRGSEPASRWRTCEPLITSSNL